MNWDCPICGEWLRAEWNGSDWILICDGCKTSRYPTEDELRDILHMGE